MIAIAPEEAVERKKEKSPMKTRMSVTNRDLEAEGVVVLPKRLETSAVATGTAVQLLSQSQSGLSFASPQIGVQTNVSPTIAVGWF